MVGHPGTPRGRAASERLLNESLPFPDHTRVRPLALHHVHLGDTALWDHDHDAAAERYEESLRLFGEHALREGPDHANEGKVLERLARLAERDDPARSVTLLNTALGHFLAADRAYQVGKVLERLGDLGDAPEQRWTTTGPGAEHPAPPVREDQSKSSSVLSAEMARVKQVSSCPRSGHSSMRLRTEASTVPPWAS